MGLVSVRNAVRTHLFRERFEVLLAVLIPFLFMAESGYACGWIFAGGHMGLDINTAVAVGRGLALEGFIFVCFKLTRVFFDKRSWFAAVTTLLVGVVAMIVSAGMNLGWMAQSPEMKLVVSAVAQFMPDWMASVFRLGLGLLFPVGVALLALFDVRHLIDEMINSSHLDHRAMLIHRSEMHRGLYLKSMKRAKDTVADRYDSMCERDAQNMANAVEAGDLSFGADKAKQIAAPSVTKISLVNPAMPPRPAALPGPQFPALPPAGAPGSQFPALPVGPGQQLPFPAPSPTQPLARR